MRCYCLDDWVLAVHVVVIGLFDLQMQYDESDNVLVRGARSVTDTVQDRLGTYFALANVVHSY